MNLVSVSPHPPCAPSALLFFLDQCVEAGAGGLQQQRHTSERARRRISYPGDKTPGARLRARAIQREWRRIGRGEHTFLFTRAAREESVLAPRGSSSRARWIRESRGMERDRETPLGFSRWFLSSSGRLFAGRIGTGWVFRFDVCSMLDLEGIGGWLLCRARYTKDIVWSRACIARWVCNGESSQLVAQFMHTIILYSIWTIETKAGIIPVVDVVSGL